MSHLRPSATPSASTLELARQATEQARFLAPEEGLSGPASRWTQARVIGLDTEFVRERTFYPRPGLIQIHDGQETWLIDPIGREDVTALTELMNDPDSIKVFHSVGEDLEIMQLVAGAVPSPLFDTQIAAAMLGFPLQCRYEVLVQECFGVELAGGQARSDWCKRPLSATLLHYAASDVVWLPELQALLEKALEKAGRLGWLQEDCQRLVDAARNGDEKVPLLRVKGAGRLDELGLGWLDRFSTWREQQCRKRDLPRSFVLRDEVLVDIAERAARGQTIEALDALPPRERRRYGNELEALLQDTPQPITRPLELIRLEPKQRDAIKAAQAEVRRIAEELGVDPALLASKRELTRLLFGERPDWADGWRGEWIGHLGPEA
ncbi:ribonuclease D [Wenzhouxiangella marina]|uniref:Uncharacterized protein n=1 Tax=Wenzhouxiangella marina TaxID=1579979 RepID=A0A0K0XVA8_9GAMM|nr:HRDC domain-containing protein [Wenzhouxiangella marina]AKS41644.1 hypothetical protein WM2015_1270 [Wenzhouxiangella marina]MBB6086596.1 ribonuclease D [Wenzhouxiangella marina]